MHEPVLTSRCLELLGPAVQGAEAVMVDATLGLGGHALAFLTAFPDLRLVGVDRDPEAIALAGERLADFSDRVTLIQGRHADLAALLAAAGVGKLDAVLFDLGVSSWQIDSAHRGFAYSFDTALDMRMDPGEALTAGFVVNEYSEAELVRILLQYGEERQAGRIVGAIAAARKVGRISTTGELVGIVREALPQAVKRRGGNPAKRTFQAIRIEVNGELAGLPIALDAAINSLRSVNSLRSGGRIAVLSYHSLEDRIVKRRFRAGAQINVPPRFPVIPDDARASLGLLTRSAEVPSEREVSLNPRAASARLRAAEKIREES